MEARLDDTVHDLSQLATRIDKASPKDSFCILVANLSTKVSLRAMGAFQQLIAGRAKGVIEVATTREWNYRRGYNGRTMVRYLVSRGVPSLAHSTPHRSSATTR